MGVLVTVRPHVVFDKARNKDQAFDQFQILIGQRVVGYLGPKLNCQPKLTAGDLPEDCLAAINEACDKVLARGKYAKPGTPAERVTVLATVVHPIGAGPAEDPPAPPADPADSAALENELR